MSANGYEKAKDAISIFNQLFPRPGINLVNNLSSLCNLKDPEQWKNPWPNSSAPGVYFIFDDQIDLLYVGLATDNIGKRLSAHIPGSSTKELKQPEWVKKLDKEVGYVASLWLPEDMWFEGLAIEAYLIRKLRPPENKKGL
jgi:hypothetical protein